MILLFGPTGAGKSMQGQMLAVRQGWKWLSTGEMLRQSQDEAVIRTLQAGELVSDDLTYRAVSWPMRVTTHTTKVLSN